MVYRIVDFNIGIDCIHRGTEVILSPYLCDNCDNADFFVRATDAEMAQMEKDFAKFYGNTEHSPVYIERLVLHKKISDEILARDGFMIHGALIEYGGTGYLFTAQSGTGKTTHVELWKKRFGDAVHIVNGDKPFMRVIDGELYGYGSPWCGKENYNINTRVKLSKLCFIERGKENSIGEISESEAVSRLMSQVEITTSRDLAAQLAMLDVLMEKCQRYLLKCNMDITAADVAYNGMK